MVGPFTARRAAIAITCTMLVGGCQQSATALPDHNVSQSDLDFMTGLTNLVSFDHHVIGSEMQRSPDPRVGRLALQLLARVDAFNAKVQPVAQRDGIAPPQDTTLFEQSDMHTRVAELMATSNVKFDEEFISDEISGNEDVLARARRVLVEPPGDPELHALAIEAVGRLQQDIVDLRSLQKEGVR